MGGCESALAAPPAARRPPPQPPPSALRRPSSVAGAANRPPLPPRTYSQASLGGGNRRAESSGDGLVDINVGGSSPSPSHRNAQLMDPAMPRTPPALPPNKPVPPPPLPPNKPAPMKRTNSEYSGTRKTELPDTLRASRSSSTLTRGQSATDLLARHASAPLPQASSFKKKPCPICNAGVEKEQMAKDSQGRNCHKECLKCYKCGASQTGTRVLEGINLVVGLNDCLLIPKSGKVPAHVLCKDHAPRATPAVPYDRKKLDESASSDGGAERNEPDTSHRSVKEKMSMAKQNMESKLGGETLPMCSRCGLPIEKNQPLTVSGMMRYHQVCPSKEEASMATKNTRHFFKKTPERLVCVLTCDAEKTNKYSFIFVVNPDSLAAGLRRNMFEDLELVFNPDHKARASVSRKLVVPTNREFDLQVREFFPFTFVDPRSNKTETPVVEGQKAVITKYFLQSGVLMVLQAVFSYDEATFLLAPDEVSVNFSMWPPRPKDPNQSGRARSVVDTNKVLKDFSVV